MKNNFPSLYLLLLLFLFLFSCGGSTDPEQKEYDSMCSSLKFKSYKTLSENTIPPILLVYNSTAHEDDLVLSESVLRLLIGYSWAVNDKPDYAVAESNIIQDISNSDKDLKFLAYSLEALALYEKGLKTMAGDKSFKASSLLNEMPSTKSTEMKKVAYHLLLGTLCIYEKNFQGARFHFAAFNSVTKMEWPYLICDAMADINEGKTKQALKKIKTIAENKDIPEEVRNSLLETLKSVEKDTKDINPKLFWTKVISQALYNAIKTSAIEGIDKISELMQNIQDKLNIE
ncbi:MAG: hypothetical protein V1904_05260 [Bacteroidota bacterium]